MIRRNKVKRVLTEREILATAEHPFIVTLYWYVSVTFMETHTHTHAHSCKQTSFYPTTLFSPTLRAYKYWHKTLWTFHRKSNADYFVCAALSLFLFCSVHSLLANTNESVTGPFKAQLTYTSSWSTAQVWRAFLIFITIFHIIIVASSCGSSSFSSSFPSSKHCFVGGEFFRILQKQKGKCMPGNTNYTHCCSCVVWMCSYH